MTTAARNRKTAAMAEKMRSVGDRPGRRSLPQFVQPAAAPNWRARHRGQITLAGGPLISQPAFKHPPKARVGIIQTEGEQAQTAQEMAPSYTRQAQRGI